MIGVVAIGRDEGARLRDCLQSLPASTGTVVYVDSGSTDGSVEWARAQGVAVVELDLARPFTAARARNEGLARLRVLAPSVSLVQFVDGDCSLAPGWLERAQAHLSAHSGCAVVCGRRRERFPERSVFNRLCDREWETPLGAAKACGGDALMRVDAFVSVGGFRADLIAGEEPELCLRLREAGWCVERLDAEMTLHDAAITRWSQWWQRSRRAGFAFAQGAHLHGAGPHRHWVRETRRAWAWGLALPLSVLALAALWHPLALALLLAYPLQGVRLYLREPGSPRARAEQAFFLVIGKFAEAQGWLDWQLERWRRRPRALIEYK